MSLVDRVKNIVLQPKQEWPVIEAETTDVKSLYTGYIMILAAIPAIIGIISAALLGNVLGRFGASVGLGFGVASAILGYALGLGMVYVIALIADALAPSFDGEKNFIQSLKLIGYSMTAGWVGGVFSIIPILGWLLSFLCSLYGFYLFYIGVSPMKKVPEGKAIGYTVVVVVITIVAYFIIGAITAAIVGMGLFGATSSLRM